MKWPFSKKDSKEKLSSTSKIIVHKAEDYDSNRTLVVPNSPNLEIIEKHIEAYLGPIDQVFHELVSEKIHLDVHWVKPSKKYNYNFLVTSGMSDVAMNVPKGAEAFKYSELAICLPPDWKIDMGSFKDENNYWPVRLLKVLARMPQDYKTWLAIDHSIANTQNYLPYAKNTKLGAALIGLAPLIKDVGFYRLKANDKIINFFFVIPLYKEEADFKIKNGTEALLNLFDQKNISPEIINSQRKNVAL